MKIYYGKCIQLLCDNHTNNTVQYVMKYRQSVKFEEVSLLSLI
jgi:hypothetical protein